MTEVVVPVVIGTRTARVIRMFHYNHEGKTAS